MHAETPSSVTDFRLSSVEKKRSWQGERLRTIAGCLRILPRYPRPPTVSIGVLIRLTMIHSIPPPGDAGRSRTAGDTGGCLPNLERGPLSIFKMTAHGPDPERERGCRIRRQFFLAHSRDGKFLLPRPLQSKPESRENPMDLNPDPTSPQGRH